MKHCVTTARGYNYRRTVPKYSPMTNQIQSITPDAHIICVTTIAFSLLYFPINCNRNGTNAGCSKCFKDVTSYCDVRREI